MPNAILQIQSVTKRFGPVLALDSVSLNLLPGQVHGLIGENGAGKSTLMKILSGVEQPNAGSILLGDRVVKLNHPVDAQRLGICMIHQELNLVEDLSVAENIFLGREKATLGWLHPTKAAAAAHLAEIGCDVPPNVKVKSLSIAQKQMVEIAKAVSSGASVMIMDEPTAVLGRREVNSLFHLMDRLKRSGAVIVFVSHILPEILEICDRVTVMRDGCIVDSMDAPQARQIGARGLASKMVGRPMADHFPPRLSYGNQTILEVKNLSSPGKVHNVSFELREGEILGLGGLIGAGRSEMAEALCGLRPKSTGQISVNGRSIRIRNLSDALSAGIAYLPEDRKGAGLTLGMSVVDNTTLVSLRRYGWPFLNRHAQEQATLAHAANLKIKLSDIHDPIESLSGGNQQKVAIAKWLEMNPRILIVDEPTRGVDIGAKEQIYQLIQSLTQRGMSCIIISSELNELIGLCHRIAVMRAGQMVAMMDGPTATEDAIMQHAAGVGQSGGAAA